MIGLRTAALVLVAATLAAPASAAGQEDCAGLRFTEVAAESGLVFRHDRGATGAYHLPETMGAGLAWIDFDDDGWLDLYVVQSGPFPPAGGPEAANRLFRNVDGKRFEEVPDAAGAADRGYGMGAIAGDLDGDGRSDLLVTNVDSVVVYLNRGGTFERRSLGKGPVAPGWSTSAALADADGDGDLDLYIARYVEYDPADNPYCRSADGGRNYCDPDLFEGGTDVFLLNDGDGSFVEATSAAGLRTLPPGKGLGVLFVDLDDDGDADIYVANDATLNFLFENRGDGTFEDVSLISGTALSEAGQAQAGMGVGIGDVNGDGLPDVAVTNFDVEMNALYLNDGALQFHDAAATSGFGLASYNLLGFGIVLADLDGDMATDAYVANGHVLERPGREGVGYAQPDLLLLGDGAGRFRRTDCGPRDATPYVGRGLAAADYDNDGDLDVAITANDGPLRLMRNERPPGPWIGLVLVGRGANTGAVGAMVELQTPSGRRREWLARGASYLASGDPRVLFTLPGPPGGGETVEVRWPGGHVSRVPVTTAMLGTYTEIREPAP